MCEKGYMSEVEDVGVGVGVCVRKSTKNIIVHVCYWVQLCVCIYNAHKKETMINKSKFSCWSTKCVYCENV